MVGTGIREFFLYDADGPGKRADRIMCEWVPVSQSS